MKNELDEMGIKREYIGNIEIGFSLIGVYINGKLYRYEEHSEVNKLVRKLYDINKCVNEIF